VLHCIIRSRNGNKVAAMMKSILFIFIGACFFLACKKSATITPVPVGKWELRHQLGGWGYDSTYVAGNGNIYEFRSNSTFKKYDKGTLLDQGTFRIQTNNNPSANSVNIILFNSDVSGQPFSMSGITMTIGTSIADGITSEYQKIAN
jgi:hypothetical protein